MNWHLKTYGGVAVGKYIWFSNISFNGLFRMNIYDDSIEYIGSFPGESILQFGLHKKCFLHHNSLFFLPARSKYLHIFNLYSHEFESILMESDDSEKIADAVMTDESIYMFSLHSKRCYRLDLRELRISQVSEFECEIEKCGFMPANTFITRCSMSGKSKICFALYDTDILAEWDFIENKLDFFHTGIEHIFSAHVINNKIWIITREENNIYCCEFGGNPQRYSSSASMNGGKNCRFYSQLIEFQKDVYGIPAFSNEIVCLRNEYFMNISGDTWSLTDQSVPAFFSAIGVKGKLWLLPFSADGIYVYEEESNRVTRREFILLDVEMRRKILTEIYKEIRGDEVIFENSIFTLNDLLNVFVNNIE